MSHGCDICGSTTGSMDFLSVNKPKLYRNVTESLLSFVSVLGSLTPEAIEFLT